MLCEFAGRTCNLSSLDILAALVNIAAKVLVAPCCSFYAVITALGCENHCDGRTHIYVLVFLVANNRLFCHAGEAKQLD